MLRKMHQMTLSTFKQLHDERRILLLGYGPALFFLLLLLFQQRVPVRELTADVASVTQLPIYTGLISNLGFLMWGAAVTICFFAVRLLWGSGLWVWFFIASGAFTLLLLLDDMFMLHETVFPAINIPEAAVYGVYLALAALYGLVFWRIIKQTNFALMLIALGLMGASLTLDLAHNNLVRIYRDIRYDQTIAQTNTVALTPDYLEEEAPALMENIYYIMEDGTKFLGVIGWMLYLATVARNRILARFGLLHPILRPT